MIKSISIILIAIPISACEESVGPSQGGSGPSISVYTARITLRNDSIYSYDPAIWWAQIILEYKLNGSSGGIYGIILTPEYPESVKVGCWIDYCRSCPVPANTIQHKIERIPMFDIDYSEYDSLIIYLELLGSFEWCPHHESDLHIGYLGDIYWSDSIMAVVEH
jgi:hypothetical protein